MEDWEEALGFGTVQEDTPMTMLRRIESKLDEVLSIKPMLDSAMTQIEQSPIFAMLSRMGKKPK